MSMFKNEFTKIAGTLGLAAAMVLSAGEAMAQRGPYDDRRDRHHDYRHDNRPGFRFDHRYDRHDRDYRYDRRDHFNRKSPRPYYRPYERPAPSVCISIQNYNYRWNRYKSITICPPRPYR